MLRTSDRAPLNHSDEKPHTTARTETSLLPEPIRRPPEPTPDVTQHTLTYKLAPCANS